MCQSHAVAASFFRASSHLLESRLRALRSPHVSRRLKVLAIKAVEGQKLLEGRTQTTEFDSCRSGPACRVQPPTLGSTTLGGSG